MQAQTRRRFPRARRRARLVADALGGQRPTLTGDPAGGPVLSTLEVALTVLLHERGHLRIVQVGANDGRVGDPIHRFLTSHADRTSVLLIEPQSELIPKLRKSYERHPDATVVNKAVGPRGDLVLYGVNPDAWSDVNAPYARDWPAYRAPTGIVSADRTHVERWLRQYYRGRLEIGALITRRTVAAEPVADILVGARWPATVDLVQVDVEGFDDEVIHSCDLRHNPSALINFENHNIPPERNRACERHLTECGYVCVRTGGDTLAIHAG